jgi:hypothetical protein
MTKTGATTGTVSILNGADSAGNPLTVTGSYNPTTVYASIVFPTPMPNSNVLVICNLDTTSANHYPWTVICAGRSATGIDLVCIQQNAAAWNSGSVDASFVAYCLP